MFSRRSIQVVLGSTLVGQCAEMRSGCAECTARRGQRPATVAECGGCEEMYAVSGGGYYSYRILAVTFQTPSNF